MPLAFDNVDAQALACLRCREEFSSIKSNINSRAGLALDFSDKGMVLDTCVCRCIFWIDSSGKSNTLVYLYFTSVPGIRARFVQEYPYPLYPEPLS